MGEDKEGVDRIYNNNMKRKKRHVVGTIATSALKKARLLGEMVKYSRQKKRPQSTRPSGAREAAKT